MRRWLVAMAVVLGLVLPLIWQVKANPAAPVAAAAPATAPAAPTPATVPAPALGPALTPLMPDSPGHYNVQFRAKVKDASVLFPCRLFIPNDYGKDPKAPWPLVIFLHGEAERGNDLAAIATVGPERQLRADPNFRNGFKCLVVSPQCPRELTWNDPQMAGAVLALLDEVSRSFRIDPDRVYLMGVGMGGGGVWHAAATAPDRFSAVAVNSGPIVSPDVTGPRLKHVPACITVSANDAPAQDGYNKMVEAINNGRGQVQFSQLGNNRDESSQGFFGNPATYDWLLQHRRVGQKDRLDRDQRDAKQLADDLAKLPRTPGNHKLVFEVWVGTQKMTVPYLLYLPRDYDKSTALCPTFLFLHGAGEGNGNLEGMFVHGPGMELKTKETFRQWCPFIGVFPIHDNSLATGQAIGRLLDDVAAKYRVDPDRVYATGLSLGGTSSWVVPMQAPDKFAAIAPMCGRAHHPEWVDRLKNSAIWILDGGADGDFTVGANQMYAALAKTRTDTWLTLVPNEGHMFFSRFFADPRLYYWLLDQHRKTPQQQAEIAKRTAGWTPKEAGSYRFKAAPLSYGLYLPKGYEKTTARLPLLVYLHGDADRGTDLATVFHWGNDADPWKTPEQRGRFPMIGLSPVCPNDKPWTDPAVIKAVLTLVDELSGKLKVDPDRIYLTGPDSGGTAAWQLALAAPGKFAGIVPVFAPALAPDQSAKLAGQTARIIFARDDGGAISGAWPTLAALRKSHATMRTATMDRDPAKWAWQPYYTDPKFCDWLLAQRRLSPAEQQAKAACEARNAATSQPSAPGTHTVPFEAFVAAAGKPVRLDYRITLPSDYTKNPAGRYPMLLYLPGSTEAGVGPAGPELARTANQKLGESFPLIVVTPACPVGRNWDDPEMLAAVLALTDEVVYRYRVEDDRVYASGLDRGAMGVMLAATEAPERFAAIVPTCAGMKADSCPLACPATWIVAGDGDGPATETAKLLVESIKKQQPEVQLTLVPPAAKDRWQGFYANPQLYEWLLRHRRRG